jgi:phosphonate metabolism protein (transferase hexapeptide repeat family)
MLTVCRRSPPEGLQTMTTPGDRIYVTDKVLSAAPTVHASALVRESTLGEWTDIGPNCSIVESALGDYTYCAGDVSIIYATVGKFCSIASHVRINPGNHPMHRVTQHHMTYRRRMFGFGDSDDDDFFQWRRDHHVTIGHDVWIGHAAVVMPGITIGTGAVIGAQAVVTKDVPSYTIVGGVPAKVIRERFPVAVAERLQRVAWWDWPRDVLAARFDDLLDLDRFLDTYDPADRSVIDG